MLQKTHLKGYGTGAPLVNILALASVLSFITFGALAADSYKVLILGDSLTAGYGLAQSDAFPNQLETALRAQGHDITIVNGGVSGDTSAGGRARLDWLLDDHTDAVLIELGANDGLRGLDPQETRKNLDWILSRLKERGLKVLLSGMKAPPNLGADYGRAFNGLYGDLAAQHKVAFDPFYLEGVAANPVLNQSDGIHPNAKGVAIIVKRIGVQVMTLLTQKKPTP